MCAPHSPAAQPRLPAGGERRGLRGGGVFEIWVVWGGGGCVSFGGKILIFDSYGMELSPPTHPPVWKMSIALFIFCKDGLSEGKNFVVMAK